MSVRRSRFASCPPTWSRPVSTSSSREAALDAAVQALERHSIEAVPAQQIALARRCLEQPRRRRGDDRPRRASAAAARTVAEHALEYAVSRTTAIRTVTLPDHETLPSSRKISSPGIESVATSIAHHPTMRRAPSTVTSTRGSCRRWTFDTTLREDRRCQASGIPHQHRVQLVVAHAPGSSVPPRPTMRSASGSTRSTSRSRRRQVRRAACARSPSAPATSGAPDRARPDAAARPRPPRRSRRAHAPRVPFEGLMRPPPSWRCASCRRGGGSRAAPRRRGASRAGCDRDAVRTLVRQQRGRARKSEQAVQSGRRRSRTRPDRACSPTTLGRTRSGTRGGSDPIPMRSPRPRAAASASAAAHVSGVNDSLKRSATTCRAGMRAVTSTKHSGALASRCR